LRGEQGNKRWEKEDIDHENELDQPRTHQQDIKINNDDGGDENI
jgi:hypothetical protein